MKFQSGILGVIIVVIALMGTIFGGYLMNVHQENVTSTNYEPVTDVTSLFNFTEQPDYIEYNPAKNFTGYTLSDGSATGVDYTSSSTINQYYMSSSTTSTITVDLSVLNSTTHYNVQGNNSPFTAYYYGTPYGTVNGANPNASTYGLAWYNPHFMSADNLLIYLESNNLIPANTTGITIIPKNSGTMVGLTVSDNVDMNVGYANNTFIVSASYSTPDFDSDYTAYGSEVREWRAFNINLSQPSYATQNTITASPNHCYLTYDVDADSWTLNVNGNTQTNVYGSIAYPSDNRGVRTYTELVDYGYPLPSVRATTDEFTLTPYDTLVDIVFSFEPVYDYMKPSDGVSVDHNSALTTNWSNGKTIGDMGIIFGNNGVACANRITTSAGSVIDVAYDGTTNTVTLNGGTPVDIGAWDHFVLRISPMNGTITVVPVQTFNSYISFTTVNYVYNIGTIPTNGITKLMWSGTSSSYTFSVTNTIVQMTTKLLMIDPVLEITNYFPLTDGYRLDINSFATYGTSMTVNGVTLYGDENNNPISDNNSVYYDGKSYKLTNIQIIRDEVDGHTYIRFVNDNVKIDLGESTTNLVSMTGLWYFNTQLDKGVIGSATEYVWDWENSFTSIQTLLIFMGLIVVVGLLANKMFHIGAVDLAIMVGAIVIIYALTEVIM